MTRARLCKSKRVPHTKTTPVSGSFWRVRSAVCFVPIKTLDMATGPSQCQPTGACLYQLSFRMIHFTSFNWKWHNLFISFNTFGVIIVPMLSFMFLSMLGSLGYRTIKILLYMDGNDRKGVGGPLELFLVWQEQRSLKRGPWSSLHPLKVQISQLCTRSLPQWLSRVDGWKWRIHIKTFNMPFLTVRAIEKFEGEINYQSILLRRKKKSHRTFFPQSRQRCPVSKCVHWREVVSVTV